MNLKRIVFYVGLLLSLGSLYFTFQSTEKEVVDTQDAIKVIEEF